MNKSDKIIITFYVFLAFSYGIFILVSSNDLQSSIVSILPKKTTDFETSRLVDVKKETIFNVMANIENFPNILPEHINYVKVLSKSDNVIIAEEEFVEAGIKTKLLVRHTIKPYNEHIIEIIDGDAKGTIITQIFESSDLQTNLITKVHLNVNGISSVITYLPESNLIHAVNTVITRFVDYSKRDILENNVDFLYHEILHRPADAVGLSYYSTLLRNGQMTENELRSVLANSDEALSMEMKPIDQLSNETKNTIDDLYEKVLLRKADPAGMQYFGNLLEKGISSDEIRTKLLESKEGIDVSVFHPVRDMIKLLYKNLLNRSATNEEINYYHKMIDDGTMTIDDVKKFILESDEYQNLNKKQ